MIDEKELFELIKTDEKESYSNPSKATKYYLKAYKNWKEEKIITINKAAMLFSVLWLLYRKMYSIGLFYLVIYSLITIMVLDPILQLFDIQATSIKVFYQVLNLAFWGNIGNILYFYYLEKMHKKGIKHIGVSRFNVLISLAITTLWIIIIITSATYKFR